MPIEMTPQMHERVVCSIEAAAKYKIPAAILLAVAEKENGKVGQWVRNNNGTHDVGPLQFNTAYLRQLARYGITSAAVASGGCYPYDLAAWRLRQHIVKDKGDLWTRVANYHSRTPKFNGLYRVDLVRRAQRWAARIASPYTRDDISLDDGAASLRLSAGRDTLQVTQTLNSFQPGQSFKYEPRRLLVENQP